MEAETLLEGYVEKIHNLRPLKDKLNFFKYGFTGKFKTIRDDIIKLDPHKWDDRDAFIKICDNRIDRLKTFTTEIVTSVCALIAKLLPRTISQAIALEPILFLSILSEEERIRLR